VGVGQGSSSMCCKGAGADYCMVCACRETVWVGVMFTAVQLCALRSVVVMYAHWRRLQCVGEVSYALLPSALYQHTAVAASVLTDT
jgi:hypothetical protein